MQPYEIVKLIFHRVVAIPIVLTMESCMQYYTKPDDWKRKLFEKAFTGSTVTGQRLGVYIFENEGKIRYEVRGNFGSTISSFPLTDEELIETFKITDKWAPVEQTLRNVKFNMLSKHYADLIYLIAGSLSTN